MTDFINTIDVLGDEAVVDGIIEGTIVELRDNVITKVGYSLAGNAVLTTVDLPSAVSIVGLSNCSALKTLVLPKVTSIPQNAFWYCSSLALVDLCAATTIGSFAFYTCNAMKALILRGNTICEIPNNININSMYVYVPSALLEEYKNYTNWSNHANRFRALEDYTVDGTVTGKFDETKI